MKKHVEAASIRLWTISFIALSLTAVSCDVAGVKKAAVTSYSQALEENDFVGDIAEGSKDDARELTPDEYPADSSNTKQPCTDDNDEIAFCSADGTKIIFCSDTKWYELVCHTAEPGSYCAVNTAWESGGEVDCFTDN